jgi:pyruvate kinase
MVAKYRPRGLLIALTDQPATQRALAVTWGVEALVTAPFSDTLTTLAAAERRVLDAGLVRPGDILIFVGSLPQMEPGRTTMLQVQVAGSLSAD